MHQPPMSPCSKKYGLSMKWWKLTLLSITHPSLPCLPQIPKGFRVRLRLAPDQPHLTEFRRAWGGTDTLPKERVSPNKNSLPRTRGKFITPRMGLLSRSSIIQMNNILFNYLIIFLMGFLISLHADWSAIPRLSPKLNNWWKSELPLVGKNK